MSISVKIYIVPETNVAARNEPIKEVFEIAIRADVADVSDEYGGTGPGGLARVRAGGDARDTAGCSGDR